MAKQRRLIASLGVLALIVVAIISIQSRVPSRVAPAAGTGAPPAAAVTGEAAPLLPDFTGGGPWINSQPLAMADLRGKVVIVDFWTYSCVNCLRTLPHLKDWYARYAAKGLVIVGVHSPEFDFERETANVVKATQKYGVTWPVVQDNDYAIWKAYGNRYWPHKYLADARGRVRYHHIGEGSYTETEQQIRELLTEAGAKLDDIPGARAESDGSAALPITRELYAGAGYQQGMPGLDFLGNKPIGSAGEAKVFADPHNYEDGEFYLVGPWQVGDEAVQFAPQAPASPPGRVILRYTAASVNAVLRSGSEAGAAVRVILDGKPLSATARGEDVSDGQVKVQDSRLYNLVHHSGIEAHVLELDTDSPDLVVYSFTFSGN